MCRKSVFFRMLLLLFAGCALCLDTFGVIQSRKDVKRDQFWSLEGGACCVPLYKPVKTGKFFSVNVLRRGEVKTEGITCLSVFMLTEYEWTLWTLRSLCSID